MGVGDAINLSGAAVHLSKRDGPITWHAFEENELSTKSIFAPVPEIKVVGIPPWWIFNPISHVVTPHTLLINEDVEIPKKCDVDLFEHIYRTHGIPYEVRWDLCPVLEASKLVPQLTVPKSPYCFIHESDRGDILPIRKKTLPEYLPWYRPDPGLGWSILAYVDVLQSAQEIHVTDSAFFHLTESVNPVGSLFLHNYARKTYIDGWNTYKTRHKWLMIN
jgi:hypothetical protein